MWGRGLIEGNWLDVGSGKKQRALKPSCLDGGVCRLHVYGKDEAVGRRELEINEVVKSKQGGMDVDGKGLD